MKSHLVALFVAVAFALSLRAADRPPLLATGTLAPDFTAYRHNGSAVKLSDYRGKVVLVDFWATWCGPCKQAMPHLESLHERLADQGLVVLGVCVWDRHADFDAWMLKPEVPTTYLKVFDPAGRGRRSIASSLYNVAGIPTFYLVGKDGKILFGSVGAGRGTERNLDAALTRAGFNL